MSKTYNVKTTTRAARPRSKRLREAGIASVTITGGGSSSGGSSGGASCDGHTHTNLPALETLSIDTNNYLYMRQYREGAVDETTGEQAEGEFATEKAKSGYADDAAHAAEADHATNADQWEEHAFGDYLDQPMRTTDVVRHEQVITEAVTTPDFTSGFGGAGAGLTRDANGNAVLELDKLVVRRSMSVSELIINQITHVGGRQIFSAAGMTVTNVEVVDGAYRCYFDTKDGNVANLFALYDQAYCQRYSADNTNIIKYYWRLVTAIGTDYIDLSMSDYDGEGVPEEGDQIAQIGNRYYTSRQSMLEIDQLSGGKLVQYAGINSYSFSQKNYLAFGVDPDTGGGYFYVYGDMFVGDRDLTDPNATYMTFQTRAGETRPRLVISADIKIGAGSSGLSNLSEWADKQQQIDSAQNTANDAATSAGNAQNTANGASTSAEEAKQIAEQLNAAMATLQDVLLPDLQSQIDGAITSYEGDEIPTATNAPAVEWTTDTERARHLNDYYDRWITATDGTKSVTRYKYTKEGTAYTWIQIADNGAAEALSSARTALGLAGTKCAVTYSATAPEVPYVVNDMWIKPDNSIYLCVVGRGESEVGVASDWTLINNAQAQLDAMAADCTFTRQEKARLRNTWAQITAEYNGYTSAAAADTAALTNARTALNTFLSATAKIAEDVNTEITAEQRTQYNALFAAWYKAVSDYTKAAADATANATTSAAKDALAKSLGYANYKAMATASQQGNTVISGGFINTDLIKTKDIIAERLSAVKYDTSGNPVQGVTVAPESGMQFKNYQSGEAELLAEFAPRDTADVETILPKIGNTYLSELELTPSSTITLNRSYTLLSHTNSSGVTQQVTIPTLNMLYYYAYYNGGGMNAYANDMDCAYGLTMTMRVYVGGSSLAYKTCIASFSREDTEYNRQDDTDQAGEPQWYEDYQGEKYNAIGADALPGATYSVPNGSTFKVELTIINSVSGSDYPAYPIRLSAKFDDGRTGTISKRPVDIDGAAIKSLYMGNTVALIRGIDQYVGISSTPTGSKMILRSGDMGVKIDEDGISMRKSNGGWDSTCVLCGYHFSSMGITNARFGVKDQDVNYCQRTAKGKYTVYHNIGHENYNASIICYSADHIFPHLTSTSANSLTFEMHSGGGTLYDRDFQITLYGKYK